jgi:hypothetical protein
MDKYTNRYLFENHRIYGDLTNSYELASVIKSGDYEYSYMMSAVDSLEDKEDRDILRSELKRRRLGL